jgi:hypothetical protein
MPGITFVVAVLLLAVGVWGYVASGGQAPTALIPAGFGVLLAVCAAVARNPKARKHAMHAAVVLALLGFLGSVPGLLQLPALLSGGPVARPLAVVSKSITAVLCLVYVVLAVRSFLHVRRERLAAKP